MNTEQDSPDAEPDRVAGDAKAIDAASESELKDSELDGVAGGIGGVLADQAHFAIDAYKWEKSPASAELKNPFLPSRD